MRACIRRGAVEIGGSCVELEHDGQRLIVDLGLPLDHELGSATAGDLLVAGLAEGHPSISGVVLSHNHPDHAGLSGCVAPDVPIWGPATAQQMQYAGSSVIGTAAGGRTWQVLADGLTVQAGPFAVTPIAVDHSAYESYALLIAAGGRRLLYSGDLRAHGRKPGMWKRLITSPPGDVDVMLMEGTTLSRPAGDDLSEHGVETRAADIVGATAGIVLAYYSAHNIDRLVSLYRAARRAGRTLVLDLYGATVAAATQRRTIPQAGWDGVRVYVPHAQRTQIIKRGAFDAIDAIAPHRIYPEELRDRAGDLVLTTRGSMTGDLDRAGCLDDAHAIWSMWPGYLTRRSGQRLQQWLHRHAIPLTAVHASGHARPEDLAQLTTAVAPKRLVPIHTAAPELYTRLYDIVERHADGEWWTV